MKIRPIIWGGCFIDLMGGEFIINPLEPKTWDEAGSPEDLDAPSDLLHPVQIIPAYQFLKGLFPKLQGFFRQGNRCD